VGGLSPVPIGTGRGCVEPSALLAELSALLNVFFLTVSNVPLFARIEHTTTAFSRRHKSGLQGKKEAAQAFLQGHVPVAQAASL
jgi:hypothetical protein